MNRLFGLALVFVISSAAHASAPNAGDAGRTCSDECDKKASDCVDTCDEKSQDKARVECKLACASQRQKCEKACK